MLHFLLKLTIPAVGFLSIGCSSVGADESQDNQEDVATLAHSESAITEVGTASAEAGDFPIELVSNGQLEAHKKAVVPFRVQDQITEVNVKEGQSVTAGQVLGKLDPFTYQKQLDDALNRHEKAIIDLEDLLLGHGYALNDTASMPANVLKMVRIRSGYNSAVSDLSKAKRDLTQTVIKAPVNGVVSNLEAREHNPSSGYKKFCEVLDISQLLFEFHLLETELPRVNTGQTVDVMPFAFPDTLFKGTVTSINPAVDDKGMVRVTARVPNPGGELMDGMNARVRLKHLVPDCLIIPKEAVLYRQNRNVVFTFEDGKAIWKYVEISHENSTHVAVSDGIKEGDEVIVENNLNLAHESEVVESF